MSYQTSDKVHGSGLKILIEMPGEPKQWLAVLSSSYDLEIVNDVRYGAFNWEEPMVVARLLKLSATIDLATYTVDAPDVKIERQKALPDITRELP